MRYLLLFLGIFLLVTTGCTKASETTDTNQFASGEQLYTVYCASCHEIEGGIGPVLSQKVIATRVNAQYLYNYNKANMPYEAGNTLLDDQYWAITAYLLMREDLMDSTLYLTAANAGEIVF